MPYGIRATLATSHESARRGFKYWIRELGNDADLDNCHFIGLSASRKMISFWCALSNFRTFETGLFYPDTHPRLSFPDKLSAKRCLEELRQLIQSAAPLIPVIPLLVIAKNEQRL